ncbi:AAA family ATPase [Paraburkholderia aspalathi]|nr:AAA family ATPase [Paraburkholderia aspalathi]MBK3780038.1 AAA family ATPase [Paraburkholderia aspalathi]
MTGFVFAVANQKGGVGKSTTSVHIGSALVEMGHTVVVVDGDPQNTVVQWGGGGEDGVEDGENIVASPEGGLKFMVANLAAAGKNIHREIKKYADNFEFVIVDCPPSVGDPVPASTLLVSDIVVMPTSSSPTDFWSSKGFVHMVEQAQVTNETLKPVWLLNKIEEKRMLTKSIKKAVEATGIPMLQTSVANRECYKQAAALGVSCFDMTDKGSKAAAAEFRMVTAELLAMLHE